MVTNVKNEKLIRISKISQYNSILSLILILYNINIALEKSHFRSCHFYRTSYTCTVRAAEQTGTYDNLSTDIITNKWTNLSTYERTYVR